MNRNLTFKLLALAVMAMVLIIALTRIEWKVQERQATRNAVVTSISSQYSDAQQIAGPLLWLRCSEARSTTRLDEKGQRHIEQEQVDCSRLVRPADLSGTGNLVVSERYRGIYKARIYLASLRMQARFLKPELNLKPGQTLQAAYWVFGVSDPRGLKRIDVRNDQNQRLEAHPGTAGSPLASGFHVEIPLASLELRQSLTADIELAGSSRLDWVPVASNNDFSLNSTWPHPSFAGHYLPDTRAISDTGFSARWRLNDFAVDGDKVHTKITSAPNQTDSADPAQPNASTWFAHSLGVSLIDPVDAYVQSDRAVRYGFLFILLTLGGFFLFELLKRQTIHPLQYLLTGFAVVVFFLLLLALSEHTGFLIAYVVASAACTLLITAYGRTLLGSWKASAVLSVGYAGLFGGLYQLLASEDHALLMGAWLTFGVLAATMYLTRKLDWREIGRAPAPVVAPAK